MLTTNELVGVVGFSLLVLVLFIILNKSEDKDKKALAKRLDKLRYPPR